MISVTEAENLVLEHTIIPVQVAVPFADSLGMVLAEPVYADRDFPPFTRVAMDGYAILYDAFENGQRTFEVVGMQKAGEPCKTLAGPDKAIEVMTGGMLPSGADTVIRYEDCTVENKMVTINTDKVRRGQSAHGQGIDHVKNSMIVEAHRVVTSAEIPIMATVGKLHVQVNTLPEVAIVSSGDELVPITQTPEDHQIRRSNAYNIKALLDSIKVPTAIYHLPDKKDVIEHHLKNIFDRHHIVILSGGVSMGKFDFIPDALEKLGVHKSFHRVEQRPGKPFWFGHNGETTVFALPGNPVSSFICALRYFMPWANLSTGRPQVEEYAFLTEDFQFKPSLTYFLQVMVRNNKGKLEATPVPGHGSGDLANLVNADGFLELPPDREVFNSGEAFRLWRYRG